MAKISHHFRLEPEQAEQLERIAKFYSTAQQLDEFLPGKKFTKTDIIEFLIKKEFNSLKEQEFEL